jgi:hypothetical protein
MLFGRNLSPRSSSWLCAAHFCVVCFTISNLPEFTRLLLWLCLYLERQPARLTSQHTHTRTRTHTHTHAHTHTHTGDGQRQEQGRSQRYWKEGGTAEGLRKGAMRLFLLEKRGERRERVEDKRIEGRMLVMSRHMSCHVSVQS